MENVNEVKPKKDHKKLWSAVLFLALAVITFHIVFVGTDIKEIINTILEMNRFYLVCAIIASLLIVVMEGIIIWYLLRELEDRCNIFRCIEYGFIGFFFSGITPSSTGGQPMQLYYMKKDKNKLSNSSAVLITLALSYKAVLLMFGIIILLFWNKNLKYYLDNFYVLFIIGMILNIMLICLIIMVMAMPKTIKKLIKLLFRFLVYIKLLKPSTERVEKMEAFIDNYHDSVVFLKNNKKKGLHLFLMTVFQRISAFSLPFFIYKGFGLSGANIITIASLQAAIYLSVDMLPLPGSQGITEVMYKSLFATIFTEKFMIPSLVATRTLNFYLLMLISAAVVFIRYIIERISKFFNSKFKRDSLAG